MTLTQKQIEQQDTVDNLIYDLLHALIGEEPGTLPWDIKPIADIREIAIDFITRHTDWTEMQLYPYVGDDDRVK